MAGPMLCSSDLKDPKFYVGLEYLLWWTSGMNAPAVLTTGPVGVTGPSGRPGVVGAPGTQVLAGGDIGFGAGSGARISLGGWLSDDKLLGADARIKARPADDEVIEPVLAVHDLEHRCLHLKKTEVVKELPY